MVSISYFKIVIILKILYNKKKFKEYNKNDRRITPDKGLLQGTYATTSEDARNVRTGEQAVQRYALPNPKPAVYVFTIEPQLGTPLRRGIVQPAYGQPGGGVEIYFEQGTTVNTVRLPPDQIPER